MGTEDLRGRLLALPRSGRVVGVVAAMLSFAVLFAWRTMSKERTVASGNRPTVEVAMATREDVPVVLRALGTVTSLSAVTVRSLISGYLVTVTSREGEIIRKGDFLAQIDPRPYRASLHQAEGQLVRDLGQLKNAQLDFARYQRLISQDSASHRDLDTAEATVSQFAGAVQSDRAQIETQRLNLQYCHIVSPTQGRVGLRQIDAGNFIQPNDASGLMVITQMRPISVIFVLPQAQLGLVLRHVNPGEPLPVAAYDQDDVQKLSSGTLSAVDNQIDPLTGTFKLRAEFANTDDALFPSQFVNIRLIVDRLKDAVTIPSEAVRPGGSSGSYVYVLDSNRTVHVRPITAGPANQGRVVVAKGVAAGETVVTDGIGQLDEGMLVSVP